MPKAKYEFDGIPFYTERDDQSDFVLIFNSDGLFIGFIDTSTSKQAMTSENLERFISDRIYALHKRLFHAGVKL